MMSFRILHEHGMQCWWSQGGKGVGESLERLYVFMHVEDTPFSHDLSVSVSSHWPAIKLLRSAKPENSDD